MGKIQRKKSTEQAKKRAKEPAIIYEPVLFLPTGSTRANLAMSDYPYGGYPMGKIINTIGDSHTGKTSLALASLAEAANMPEFDNHDLFFDDAEYASEFDIQHLFGNRAGDRITMPESPSESVEEFFVNILRMLDKKKPFIYLLDSLDALYSKEDEDRAAELDKKIDTDEDIAGSYGQGKPKTMSWMLRLIRSKIKKTNSMLNIVSQTRANLGFGAKFKPKIRSGGNALDFYASIVFWLSVIKTHTVGPKGKTVAIGGDIEMNVTKNKITGKKRKAKFPLYDDYGLDDITSCLWYLKEMNVIGTAGAYIQPHEIFAPGKTEETMYMSDLITTIEKQNLEPRLIELVAEQWKVFEDSIKLSGRKRKYA